MLGQLVGLGRGRQGIWVHDAMGDLLAASGGTVMGRVDEVAQRVG